MFLTWLQLANDAGTGVVPQDSSLEEQNLLSFPSEGIEFDIRSRTNRAAACALPRGAKFDAP